MAKLCRLFIPLLLLASGLALGADDDALISQAHEAWSKHQLAAVKKLAARATQQQDSLADYVNYWQLDLELGQIKNSAALPEMGSRLRHFWEQYPDTPVDTSLRVSWLKTLALYQDWNGFEQSLDSPSLADREVACLELQRRVNQNAPNALNEARDLWFKTGYPSASCIPLFRRLQDHGLLGEAEVIKPLQRAFASHDLALVTLLNSFLPSPSAYSEKELVQADLHPLRFLEQLPDEALTLLNAQLVVFAIEQLARKNPQQAADHLLPLESRLTSLLRGWAWQQIGRQAVMIHDPQALEWFNRGQEGDHEDELSGWWLRAALLKQDWKAVLDALDSMTPEERTRPAWQYWQAHALLAQGDGRKAYKILKQLSMESNYYGLLALEALGKSWTPPLDAKPVQDAELVNLDPSLSRSLRLRRLGLVAEARSLWAYQIRGFTPRQRHAASYWAAQHQWFDRAIYSIERADNESELGLRFPLPEKQLLDTHCANLNMDEAWVYGLMKQESYFATDAKSRTGAAGLMQLMPTTARWVAKKIPLKGFNVKQLSQPAVNVRLGVWFLHHLHEVMGSAVLATAGYNSGPGRVARWLATAPADVPIFIETIPFDETRGYVQKVMYNATIYTHRLGLPGISLNQRLGNAGKMRELLQQADRLEKLEEMP